MRLARALALVLLAVPAMAAAPRLSPQRLVLRTTGGDVVLGLYEGAAPKTVARVLELARLGVYDGARFTSIVPGFYAEIGETSQRSAPLTPEQAAAVLPLPAELSALRHRRGVLSMARQPSDLNSARSAFSIMLGDWPQGDGQYTIFGEVVAGMDVLDTLAQAPTDAEHRPISELQVYKAQVLSADEAAKTFLAPAHLLIAPSSQPQAPAPSTSYPEAAAAGFVLLAALAAYACMRFYPRAASPLLLVSVLSCMFLVLMLAGNAGQAHPLLGAGLFLALLGTLRLMSSFESQA